MPHRNGWTSSALLADLQARTSSLNAMMLQPGIHSPDDVLGASLHLARTAMQAAGVNGDEAQRLALYQALVGYLDTPAGARPVLSLVDADG